MCTVEDDWEEIGSESSAAPVSLTDMQLGPMIQARGNDLISGLLLGNGGGRRCQGGDGGCMSFPAQRGSAFGLGSFFRRMQGVDALALQTLVDDIVQMASEREGELVAEYRRLQDAHEAMREENYNLRRLMDGWHPKLINDELRSQCTTISGKNSPSLYSFDARSTCVEESTEVSSVRSEDTFATSPSYFGDFAAPYSALVGNPSVGSSNSHTSSNNSEDSEEDEGFGALKCRGVKKGDGAVTPPSKDGRPKQIAHIRIRQDQPSPTRSASGRSSSGSSPRSRSLGGDALGEDARSELSDEDLAEFGGVCSDKSTMEPIMEQWESRSTATNCASLSSKGTRMSGVSGPSSRGSRKRPLQGERVKQGFEAAMNYKRNAARLLKGRCDGPIRRGNITTFSI